LISFVMLFSRIRRLDPSRVRASIEANPTQPI
jgi:hypothetical protein